MKLWRLHLKQQKYNGRVIQLAAIRNHTCVLFWNMCLQKMNALNKESLKEKKLGQVEKQSYKCIAVECVKSVFASSIIFFF